MISNALFPVFLRRSFGMAAQPGLRFKVERMTWDVMGGCRSARLAVRVSTPAGALDLDQFGALLRCPVVILTSAGRQAWWGLVWSVRILDNRISSPLGGDKVGVLLTLDDLCNRVRTVYGLLEPEATGGGVRRATAWGDDLNSQAAYGVKEGQFSLNLASTSQAESFRDHNLAAHRRTTPRPIINPAEGTHSATTIMVDLRGWWETLDWRYYTNTDALIENLSRAPNYLRNFCTLAGERVGQQITVSSANWQIESLWVALRRVNAGSTLTASLCADSGGSPGAVLASTTRDGATLTTGLQWVEFVLTSPYTVSVGTYWIVFQDNAMDNYQILCDPALGYGGGAVKFYSGGAWGAAATVDLQFRVSGTMETTEQLKLMAASTAGGQFLAGVRVDQASGIYTNPRRLGDTTALEEIKALLEGGTSAGVRLQAAISAERHLLVSNRPDAAAAKWLVRSDGIVRLPGGQIAPPGPGIAGSWAVLDTQWALNSASWMTAPGRMFIERAEWCGGVCRAVGSQD